MNIKEFLKQSKLYDALATEASVSEDRRKKILYSSEWIIVIVLLLLAIYTLVKGPTWMDEFRSGVDFIAPILLGIIVINIGLYIFMKMLGLYILSVYYFEKIVRNKYQDEELYSFSAGRILYAGRNTDILHGVFYSELGRKILARLGINKNEARDFIKNQKKIFGGIPDKTENILKIKDLFSFVYKNNDDFKTLLRNKGVDEKTMQRAVDWVVQEIESVAYKKQWWRKERLNMHGSIASDWSFGQTFTLDRFSTNILETEEVSSDAFVLSERDKEVSQLESILLKSNEANAVVIGEPGQEKMHVIWSLSRKIRDKVAPGTISARKPVLLRVSAISAFCKDKETLENTLIKILNESSRAGNIMLVIDNFPSLLSLASGLDLNISELMDPYLASASIQFIAIANTTEFHEKIENNKGLMNRFEKIFVEPMKFEEVAKVIARSALEIEDVYKILFTYQAVEEISKSAEYYFPEGVTSDKALDILREISPWAIRKGLAMIDRDDVLEYIQEKTGIPTGQNMGIAEREKLLNLEILLAQRVIGQKDALLAVSNAIRRSKSGIRNPNRPIGSFLFLGPTGVGKTETSKALSHVFFGSEEYLMRLDMTEYQTDDSMDRLIGSFGKEKSGVLANMIRQKPFGVLLLDEFEKTHKDVLNLFLQILDEGFFSDAQGKRVSTKNIIFIATSNAGAEKIFQMVSSGRNPKEAHDEIIAEIVDRGILRPELINRFDATIIFRPLEKDDLEKIAEIMLKRVAERLKDKGITMDISKELVDYIIEGGSNKVFGARPMNRFIQDSVEEKIATLVISKELFGGKRLSFEIKDKILNTKIS